ncbi:SDR family oxidoreductase [Acidimangrovimonas sediminis]|uniref:SDR family oxidoreductase n=1 Tax=Acidimangrovimonas sediminis TaxID=2056283 RepID=UPI000C7FD614|nr:SDR family oxidoreductase [Acidimangrovimonas sediminis]
MTLTETTLLVVGGSSGIGFGVAQAALKAGAAVTIASRSAEKVEKACARLGGKVEGVTLDTADAAGLEAFFADRSFDHLFCSAASTRVAAVRELPLEDAYAAMQSKFWGAYRLARAARIAPGGSITLISGTLSTRPKPGTALQGAINAGLEGLTRGLAVELAPLRVNCIAPGLVKTEMVDTLDGDGRKAMFEGAAERLPAGLVGGPEMIAVQALAIMANPYMTGATVAVDGGGVLV